ncbi:DIE2/ALG10 family-domain-containing protein [Amylocarpus encephaloides]|uniref:Dol-P-Glc:Glc(2)Man(9)GlcNAc(2)-PP-Dol alpha-1,2-glucosyltransferase n=1 Tax=Amylocarpus encephaloides TaxID=45428 RepID=A0A9P8BZM8_9HELO|nr:DIE2/ALG10 family-domain-containing protein [Amylocarpus encephaloides]
MSAGSRWRNLPLLELGGILNATIPWNFLQGDRKYLASLALLVVYLIASFWESQVTKIVNEPYLDEVFHIPQAQAYCRAQYQVWDPKLTTPPGLYAFSVLFLKIFRGVCDVGSLRLFNVFALLSLTVYTLEIRSFLTAPSFVLRSRKLSTISTESIHTALNIALFPPLFFFSGLYYTDVLSTRFVLLCYRLFLDRKGVHNNSGKGLYMNYFVGILALTMRQTNIFWVAIFLGESEVMRAVKANVAPAPMSESGASTPDDTAFQNYKRWARGAIHDVVLEDASPLDFILMPMSLIVAILHQPVLVISRLWPYIALLVSFAAFVFYNGGVVLGDKSSHVATIHLPQLLYLSPFILFFSAPLVLPMLLTHVLQTIKTLTSPFTPKPTTSITSPIANNANPSIRHLLTIANFLIIQLALLATIAIIHFNTIIHPFTLADNRHYVFYVFRYSILRAPWIRYALGPVYLTCAYAVYISLVPTPGPRATTSPILQTISTKPPSTSSPPKNRVSTVIMLLIPTILSLVTAPLVEPRYFIIPWVMYRLHLPQGQGGMWLWLETLWFLAINAVTGYIFLYLSFEWGQEPGRVQRFMW